VSAPSARRREAIRWAAASLPLSAVAGVLYIFFEWLFFITKPSPVAELPFPGQLSVLVETPLPALLPLVGAQVVASLLSLIAFPRVRLLALVPAAAVGGVLLLVLLDNFTYTVVGYGIIMAGGPMRLFYAMLLALFAAIVLLKLAPWLERVHSRRRVAGVAVAFAGVMAAAPVVADAVAGAAPDLAAPPSVGGGASNGGALPNILFLGADGVSADLLSAYGYGIPTSPFLERLREETLFFENAFSNVAKTHGSLVSLLTGRLPFSTRVTFPPTILQGEDSRKHLPGFLKSLGYTTLQLGMRHYADAADANLLGAFDAANYRWQRLEGLDGGAAVEDETDAFRTVVSERLVERVGHIFGLREAANDFAHVEGRAASRIWSDERRVETFLRWLPTAPRPWFVHMHLLDTHCCNYAPSRMHFTFEQVPGWAARDSQLRETDRQIETIFRALAEAGQLEQTVVVISSDHTWQWQTTGRIPLMIRFPAARIKGRVSANVQIADVAPTMLAYLGRQIPDWMDGVPLLDPTALAGDRLIFGVSDVVERTAIGQELKIIKDSGPPNYGARAATVIAGNRWLEVNLLNGAVRSGPVEGHTGKELAGVSGETAREQLRRVLARAGFRIGP
jgi:arylsulfatase A-like enzyme